MSLSTGARPNTPPRSSTAAATKYATHAQTSRSDQFPGEGANSNHGDEGENAGRGAPLLDRRVESEEHETSLFHHVRPAGAVERKTGTGGQAAGRVKHGPAEERRRRHREKGEAHESHGRVWGRAEEEPAQPRPHGGRKEGLSTDGCVRRL
ncbi:MAG: hypothetical protein AB9866_26550 [Syntrophobacteraceae bacterium]